jgi:hypothetical protein
MSVELCYVVGVFGSIASIGRCFGQAFPERFLRPEDLLIERINPEDSKNE